MASDPLWIDGHGISSDSSVLNIDDIWFPDPSSAPGVAPIEWPTTLLVGCRNVFPRTVSPGRWKAPSPCDPPFCPVCPSGGVFPADRNTDLALFTAAPQVSRGGLGVVTPTRPARRPRGCTPPVGAPMGPPVGLRSRPEGGSEDKSQVQTASVAGSRRADWVSGTAHPFIRESRGGTGLACSVPWPGFPRHSPSPRPPCGWLLARRPEAGAGAGLPGCRHVPHHRQART